jgi:hypothetical protein
VARADQEIVLAGEQEAEGKGPAQARQGHGDGFDGRAALAHLVGDELGHHLGVRLGLEGDALGLKADLQLPEILDDAVMDHRQPVGGVRVGVGLVGPPVGGPAGMPDADDARKRGLGQLDLEVASFPSALRRSRRPPSSVATPAES